MEERVLTRHGYRIPNSPTDLKPHKKALTVRKAFNPKTSHLHLPSDTIHCWKESESFYYLPRAYGRKTFGNPKKLIGIDRGLPLSKTDFNGQLRERQEEAVTKYMNHIKKKGFGGLLNLHTGFGKTVVAIAIALRLGVKTIVISHKNFLSEQWMERISQYAPDCSVGGLKDDNCPDFKIGTVQGVMAKSFNNEMVKGYGFVIFDECHHMAASVFSKAFSRLPMYNILGLTATIQRKDGLQQVFLHHIGDVVDEVHQSTRARGVEVENVSIEQIFPPLDDRVKLITLISECSNRTTQIVNKIEETLRNEPDRVALVLSERRNHLAVMEEALRNKGFDTGFYVGGMKQKDLDVSATKSIIFATYSMASEGLDIKRLNTLFMTTPCSSPAQPIGRILRADHENVCPLVVDFLDDGLFRNAVSTRKRFYKNQGFQIKKADKKEEQEVKFLPII